uniref:Uncharacterized protein n=1 Tax=Rhizophora mucronata TaxID=61149 RepID=A0A2P2IK96_RHIMU
MFGLTSAFSFPLLSTTLFLDARTSLLNIFSVEPYFFLLLSSAFPVLILGCCKGELRLMVEPLGCEVDLLFMPPLLVRNPRILLFFSGLTYPLNASELTEKLDTCFKPSSNVFTLSLNFS